MAVVKGKDMPITLDLVKDHVRLGIWIPVGLCFVNECTKHCATTGHVYNKEGFWYQRHVPEAEWKM